MRGSHCMERKGLMELRGEWGWNDMMDWDLKTFSKLWGGSKVPLSVRPDFGCLDGDNMFSDSKRPQMAWGLVAVRPPTRVDNVVWQAQVIGVQHEIRVRSTQ